MRSAQFNIALMLTVAFSAACGGSAANNFGSNSSSDAKKKPASSDQASDNSNKKNTEEDESTKSDQPSMVAGAFLTCSYLGSDSDMSNGLRLTADPSNSATNVVGCGIYKDKSKVDLAGRGISMQLLDEKKNPVSIDTLNAPDTAKWHMFAMFPDNYKNKGTLRMTVVNQADQSSSDYDLATSAIEPYQPLGSVQAGDPTAMPSPAATGAPFVKPSTTPAPSSGSGFCQYIESSKQSGWSTLAAGFCKISGK